MDDGREKLGSLPESLVESDCDWLPDLDVDSLPDWLSEWLIDSDADSELDSEWLDSESLKLLADRLPEPDGE